MQAHTLRRMRYIHLVLDTHRPAVENEQFLKSFVEIISGHDEGVSDMSMLTGLEVRLTINGKDYEYDDLAEANSTAASMYHWSNTSIERCMFTLEVLTKLPKIEHVKIFGPPKWLVQCLQLGIQDGGCSIAELRWPTRKVRKTKNHASYHRSARLAGEPILDWQQFAQLNVIALPKRMTNFFQRHNASYPR